MRHRWILGITIVAILAGGCVRAGSSAGPSPSPSPLPTISSASTAEPLPSGLEPEILHAIDMRRSSGLRYDLEYVLASMSDPRATSNLLDFPLYPEEEAKLIADQADQDVAVRVIQAYAVKHEDEYGGVYIDRDEHPGIVTALWTGHLAEHQQAINDDLDGRFVILRLVRYSYASLQGLADKTFDDHDWMGAIPAEMWGLGVDIIDNVIDLEVSSAEPTAVEQIADHYSLGDRLRVTSDGTGAMLLPRGTVKGRVVGPAGDPIVGELNEGLSLQWTNEVPGDCGGGDIGYGVDSHGRFELPCQVGRRTIIVMGPRWTDDGWEELGRATVTVPAGETVKLTIRLTKEP